MAEKRQELLTFEEWMNLTENKEEEQLVVKRVVKSQIWIMMDDDVLKALSANVPITFVLGEEHEKIVKESLRTKGPLEINLIRKKGKGE